jgi:multiple sugar transport system permease protein
MIRSERIGRRRLLGRDWRLAWLFTLPLVAVLALLIAYPFVTGILLSLQHKAVGGPATWIGLQNYADLLWGQYGTQFRQSVLISAIYTGVAIASKLVLGMCMALMLNERFRGRTLVRTLLFLPWAAPTIVVALDWRWIYDGSPNGMLNAILLHVFHHDMVQFLSDPKLALWAVIASVVWQGTPFYTMMFLAGLQAVPNDQYEAGAMDGAGVWRRFRYITLPSLKPAIIVTTLLSTIWTANSINFVYVLTTGGPAGATMTFPMLAYTLGLSGARQLGLSAAVSICLFPVFIVVIYALTRRMLGSEGSAR